MKKLIFVLCLLLATSANAQEIFTDGRTTAGFIVQDEGTSISQSPYLNFTGAGVTATSDSVKTYVAITSGSGDISSVGPSCTTGSCLVDGDDNETIMVLEGDSDNTEEITIKVEDPDSDTTITIPDDKDGYFAVTAGALTSGKCVELDAFGRFVASADPCQNPSGGNVTGTGNVTDHSFARYDGTTGLIIQTGDTVEDDSGNVTVNGDLTVTGAISSGASGRYIINEGLYVNNEAGATETHDFRVSGDTVTLIETDAGDETTTFLGAIDMSGATVDLPTIWARAYHNTTQSIADTTDVTLAFNAERYDTDTIHDNSTNNSRLTATTAGIYLITASVEFDGSASGNRWLVVELNGTTKLAGHISRHSDGDTTYMSISTIYSLSATDYVEVYVYQNSGGPLNIRSTGNLSPEFSMIRLGS